VDPNSNYTQALSFSSQHLAVQLGLKLHGHEFLKEKLASIGNANLADVLAAVTRLAVVLELIQVSLTEEAALLAHVHPICV
jgi:hypothetical protein